MPSVVHLPLLSSAVIASPCEKRWEDMRGDERVRRCGACNLDVYNFAAMTAEDAETLLRERAATGGVCARLYRRADGTILTADCPVGVAMWRRRTAWAVARVGAAAAFLLGAVSFAASAGRGAPRVRTLQPFRAVCEWLNPSTPLPSTNVFVRGRVSRPVQPVPLPPAPTTPTTPTIPTTPQVH